MNPDWETPPKPRHAGKISREHQEIADKLRANPGQWIVLRDHGSALAYRIRSGLAAAFRPVGAWEATCRNTDQKTGRADVYIRYIGGDDE